MIKPVAPEPVHIASGAPVFAPVVDDERRCPVCGGSMAHMRKDATSCSPPCRADLSRLRRWDALSGDFWRGLSATRRKGRVGQLFLPEAHTGPHDVG